MKIICAWMLAASVAGTAGSTIAAQTGPLPTAEMQPGIAKDISRHFGSAPVDPGPIATDLSPALTSAAVDMAIREVADWQLEQSQPYFDRIWTWSVLYSGFIAASAATGDPKYLNAMKAMSEKFNWEERNHQPNANDLSVAQTYLELYLLAKEKHPEWIAPTRAEMASVIDLQTLSKDTAKIPWWWCDALFMAPPTWAKMYAATHDHKYIDYLDAQWAKTSDLLYDNEEHLYARDATFIPKRGPNGKKIFWSRGEGWVMAGIARTVPYLPKDDPRRTFYQQQLREMAARVAQLQDPVTGLWHASLLDPEHFPAPEISGSALMVFAITWGINEGVLDAKTYTPVITKGWEGLLQHVYNDGRLGDIQQTGAEPAYFLPGSSFTYGIGGFLLAGAELKRFAATHPSANQHSAMAPDTVANTDPSVYAKMHLPSPKNPQLPDLILVGDSTVRNGNGDGAHNQMGWGDAIGEYFDTTRINVVNRAIGGRSSRTYITEGHWNETLKLVRPGDIVLIQFGHNDSGPLDDVDRARGSLPGTGDETRDIENPVRKRHETVHTFGWYLEQYVHDVRAKGATPILCSLVPRKIWVNGNITRQTESYRGWTQAVAAKEHVGYIDLNEITAEKYDALGESAVEPLFGDPHTHTTATGATMNAESVIAGLKALRNDPAEPYFSAKAATVPPFHEK
ncbi:MAG TPA: glycoside hydrolase family 88 protein [Edaphobacter sp.]|nr:glycoside hydrolase family 88 protein [Edaphobacter sp.]